MSEEGGLVGSWAGISYEKSSVWAGCWYISIIYPSRSEKRHLAISTTFIQVSLQRENVVTE